MSAHDEYIDCVYHHAPDLMFCGTVLTEEHIADTRLYNMRPDPSFTPTVKAYWARRRADIHGPVVQGRLQWLRDLLLGDWEPIEQSHRDRYIATARAKWGDTEFERLSAIVRSE